MFVTQNYTVTPWHEYAWLLSPVAVRC